MHLLVVGIAVLCAQSLTVDTQQQIKEMQEAVRLSPSDAEAHARLGIAYRKIRALPEAAESFERAVRLNPEPRVQVLLAITYMDSGRHRDAIPLLAASFEAEQKDSVKSVVGQRLVECYLATGGDENALPIIQKLRQLAPDDLNVLYLSSKVYMNLWNGAFRLMLDKSPGSYQVHLIRAEALESQERFAEAAHEYREILKKAPSIGGIHFRLGRAILRSRPSGDAGQEALAEFLRELEVDPVHVEALTAIGEIHLERTRLQEAAGSFSRAIKLQPGDVPARVGLAKVLIAEKKWSQALEHLEAAARAAPGDEAVHYNLMLAHRGLGRTEDAKRAFDAFQRLREQKTQK